MFIPDIANLFLQELFFDVFMLETKIDINSLASFLAMIKFSKSDDKFDFSIKKLNHNYNFPFRFTNMMQNNMLILAFLKVT